MARPRNSMAPASARSWPVRMLNSVDLPAPLGPISARISPRASAMLTPATAWTPPKDFRTASTRRTGGSLTTSPGQQADEAVREGQHQRAQGEAERRPPDHGYQREAAPAGRQREIVVGERRGQPRRRPDAEQAVVAAGDVVPLMSDGVGDLAERERQHREVDAAEANAEE